MRRLRLKDLGRWSSGGTPPREDEQAWLGNVPWISAKDIDRTNLREPVEFITREAAVAHSRLVPDGSVLLIVRGMALAHGLSVVQIDREVAFNQDLRALVCSPAVNSRFAYYALRGTRLRLDRHIDRAAHGTARVTDSLFAERLRIPDLRGQRTIVAFLDLECGRITDLLQTQGSLRHLLTERWRSEADELLDLCDGPQRPLHTVVDSARAVMYGIVLPGEAVEQGVLLVKGGNVERHRLMPSDLVRVDSEIERRHVRSRLVAGDLLVTIRGSYGAVATVPPETAGANITQDTARVAPSPEVDGQFLLRALQSSRFQRQLAACATGSGVRGVNIFDLKRARIPIPSLQHQRRIARSLSATEGSLAALETELSRFSAALAEYRDALISEAVTGQLDVTKPSEEQLNESARAAIEGERSEVLST